MADGQSIVRRALEQLRSTISPEDDRSFMDTNLRDVWAVAREIENKQAARLAMRNMARIEPILRTLESYSGVIDTFCQGFSPMAFVWGPIKLMLQLGRQHFEILEKLLQALKDIGDVLPMVDRMKATFGDEGDFQRTLGLIYSDLLEFLQRVYKFLRRRAWHFYFTVDWGLFERRFKSILGTLKAHCELLGRQAAAIHYFEMRKMRDLRQMADEEYERERQRKMVHEVFAWLSAAEAFQEDYLHQLSDTRQLRTCDWILEHDKIYPWMENESGDAVIWMTGIPGAGKSVLCSLLIENLQTRQDITSLYYFCGQRRAEDDCGTVLRTFILQILQQNPDLAPLVHQAYYQKAPSRSKKSVMTMLRELLSNLKITRIVLDGIDEWDVPLQEELLRGLVELQKHSGDSCKVLVSSRHEPQINKAMSKKTEFPLEGNTTGGLQQYIHKRVLGLEESFPRFERELIDRVELRLRQMARGMFLWVHLVTRMLQQQVSELTFEEAIERLPDGLDQAYGRILSRINDLNSDRKERAFRILFWLCATYRPMKVQEVADGITLRPGQAVLNRKTRFQDTNRDIVEFCAPMVVQLESGVLSLVHFSAKKYLLDPQSGPFLAIVQAHFDIAFSCITNLTSASNVLPRFSRPGGKMTEAEIETSVVQGSYALQEYGHRFWAEHVREYAKLASDSDHQSTILTGALNAFCVVQKGHAGDEPLSGQPPTAEELPGLARFPALQNFVNKWLHFRSELDKMGVDFDNLDAQNQWQLQKDETYLTLIDHRLREATERLLSMDQSSLPSHIHAVDFTDFMDRFGFNCRYHMCTHNFDTARSRDMHEATHTPSFPCLQCDFSGRGFRSRRDLSRHIKQYHMSIEDFEIPTTLTMASCNSSMSQFGSSRHQGVPARMSKCWNERGRDILRKSFRQALDRIESDMMSAGQTHEGSTTESGTASGTIVQTVFFNDIREKVGKDLYESLLDFKNDVQSITSTQNIDDVPEGLQDVDLIVDQEVGMVMSGFPDFANLPQKSPQPRDNRHSNMSETLEAVYGEADVANTPDSYFSGTRVPYWSVAEKAEFPKLLEQYGSNYPKLSNCLKTKSPEDVEHHLLQLLSSGGDDLARLVKTADARSGASLDLDGSDSMVEAESTSVHSPELSPQEDSDLGIQSPVRQHETALLAFRPPVDLGADVHKRFRKEQPALKNDASTTGTEAINEPPKKKKRLLRKGYCPDCKSHPEFSSESSYNLHHLRIHQPTRKIWVCKDVSIDKKFLAGCPACVKQKSYRAKHNAYTHLRKHHFPRTTPIGTLERWMKEMVETNPAYQAPESGIQVAQDPNPLSSPRRMTRNPNASGGVRLKGLADIMKELDDSPSPSVDQSNNSQSDVSTPDRGQKRDRNGRVNARRDILFQGVSFEQVLADSTSRSIGQNSLSTDEHSSKSASDPRRVLISGDQVPRLPHLRDYQKAVCQDQVDALHHVLDTESSYTKAYEEAFEKLESLSCTLMEDLRNWRRRQARAPNIPFSI